jgi:hypothetical protein
MGRVKEGTMPTKSDEVAVDDQPSSSEDSTRKGTRKPIPAHVRDAVLREAGYYCGNPACRNVITLELHHIEWVKDGGGNEPMNLLALCPYCHAMHTAGQIPVSAIRHWKGLLVALNHAFNKEGMDLLLFLASREDMENLWMTGDGFLKFAPLVAAGLVEIAETVFSVGPRFSSGPGKVGPPHSPPTTALRVKLSDKGKLLVDSWKRGDEDAYARALGAR